MYVKRGNKLNKNDVLRQEHKLMFLQRQTTLVQVHLLTQTACTITVTLTCPGYKEAAHAHGAIWLLSDSNIILLWKTVAHTKIKQHVAGEGKAADDKQFWSAAISLPLD